MVKKVYTIEVDDENLRNTAKSKSVETKKSALEKEIEGFGIEQINNASAKGKLKNVKDAGFEKNVTGCSKKSIKSKIHEVEDYFDFSFRPEIKKVETAKVSKTKTASKTTSSKAKKTTVYKVEEIVSEERETALTEAQERKSDEAADKIVCTARLGSLFG